MLRSAGVHLAAISLFAQTLVGLAGEITVCPEGKTIGEALADVRAARAAGDTSVRRIAVEGFNVIEKTVVLTDADHDLEIVGAPGATFSGGIRLTDWKDEGDGVWSCTAPRNAAGEPMFFDQLWLNGRRAPNARLPNEGFLRRDKSAWHLW